MLQTLIVGYGHSGRHLHAPCVARARERWTGPPIFATGRPFAIDPITPLARASRRVGEAILRKALNDLDEVQSETIVAHVCTPPSGRARVIEMLARAGIRRVIIEKPLAESIEELDRLMSVARQNEMEIAVAMPWLSSSVTHRLRQRLKDPSIGPLRSARIVQEKPRFQRSLNRIDHSSVFDIEMPHGLGLMIHLAGPPVNVREASCTDMQVEDITIPYLGNANLVTLHNGDITVDMHCDLAAPVRRREVHLVTEQATLTGWYSVGSDDLYGQVMVTVNGSPPSAREVIFDDAFTTLFLEWYAYFAGEGPRPISDLELNESVVRTLTEAKALSGVRTASDSVWGPTTAVGREE